MAQLAIPQAPRAVALTQLPGAVRRLALVGSVGLVLVALVWGAGYQARAWLTQEREFLARAVEVKGTLAEVSLPPASERDHSSATLRVLFTLAGESHTASGVPMEARVAEGLGRGASVDLLVDPTHPEHAREKQWAGDRQTSVMVANLGLGLGVLLTLAFLVREGRRALRRELDPLRVGAIVWLTPSVDTLGATGEFTFPASYFRDDVKHEVTARAVAGGWVRNGEKVLAALVPTEPTWVLVIDEALAKRLGWYR
jgi:hypothetical protein